MKGMKERLNASDRRRVKLVVREIGRDHGQGIITEKYIRWGGLSKLKGIFPCPINILF